MILDYIYHSGFALEAEGVTVIIDYYKDSSEAEHSRGIVHDYLLQKPGKLYVLATHFHPDHFNREILTWKEQRPDIHYIFSKDILKSHRAQAEDAIYIKKGETYEDETLRIDAFGSTDVGSSFLIHLQDWSVFHAGDLNNWHWSEESTEEEIRKAAEIACIWDYIETLPQGLETVLTERGEGLSEGQVQRIAIARAILNDAPILLLDECTSSLDKDTEWKVLQNLKKMNTKTIICISHTAAGVACCDRVVEIENKKFKEVSNDD